MSDPNQNGEQTQPTPESGSDRDAMRAQVIKANPDWGKSDEPSTASEPVLADEKQEKAKPEPVKQENGENQSKPSRSGFERRIGTLTAKTKQLEAELARLRGKGDQQVSKVEPKKFTRDSFKSDEEYWDYLADKKAEEKVNQRMEQQSQSNNEMIQSRQQEIEFQRVWQKREEDVFKGNDAAREQYRGLLDEHHDTQLPNEVWDVINDSDISPFLLSVVLSNEDLRNRINAMGPIRRGYFMLELEKKALAYRQSAKPAQEQKTAISSAPTPVGEVRIGGASKSDSELSMREIIERRKKERGIN